METASTLVSYLNCSCYQNHIIISIPQLSNGSSRGRHQAAITYLESCFTKREQAAASQDVQVECILIFDWDAQYDVYFHCIVATWDDFGYADRVKLNGIATRSN